MGNPLSDLSGGAPPKESQQLKLGARKIQATVLVTEIRTENGSFALDDIWTC